MKFRILVQGMVAADGERFGLATAHWLEVPVEAETKAEAAARFSDALAQVASTPTTAEEDR